VQPAAYFCERHFLADMQGHRLALPRPEREQQRGELLQLFPLLRRLVRRGLTCSAHLPACPTGRRGPAIARATPAGKKPPGTRRMLLAVWSRILTSQRWNSSPVVPTKQGNSLSALRRFPGPGVGVELGAHVAADLELAAARQAALEADSAWPSASGEPARASRSHCVETILVREGKCQFHALTPQPGAGAMGDDNARAET